MKPTMSCGGGGLLQKKPLLPQDSQTGYEDLILKGGGGADHGGKQEALLCPGSSPSPLQAGSCPQCRRLLRVVYVTVGLMVVCFGLILGMGLLQYKQYTDSMQLGQRLEEFCPGGRDTTAPPGSASGGVGMPPRGADVRGGPWDLVPPTTPDYDEEEVEVDDGEKQRGKRSATGESEGHAESGRRRTRHRNKRCISCPTNMTTVDHLEGYPNSMQKPGDMFRNWKLSDWSTGVKNSFNGTTGELIIKDPGLYWVYGQVMFYNSVFDNGFSIKIFRHSETAPSTDGEHLAMCMHTTDYNNPATPQYNDKYRTCNVGIPAVLNMNDRIGVASLYEGRMVVFSSTSSFWGVIKQSPPPP